MEAINTKPLATAAQILQAIGIVSTACETVQAETPDLVLQEIDKSPRLIGEQVKKEWPLSEAYKQQIIIGPLAAKNLSDWQLDLAHSVMALDYCLRHDGFGIDALLAINLSGLLSIPRRPNGPGQEVS